MVWPAAVTPFDERGRIDYVSMARLLAFFEAAGCTGVVLAGTTGEGPSLSAVEKRDLMRESVRLRGRLNVILGLATNSLDEAIWLGKRAAEFGATGVLAVPPNFHRNLAPFGLRDWYLRLMESSPAPVLVYHHPALVGVSLATEDWTQLAAHPNFLGAKTSSGYEELLPLLPTLAPDKILLMGNERDLCIALNHGWSGTISAVANVVPHWLVQVIAERNEAKLKFLEPIFASVRGGHIPGNLKSVLTDWGILERADVRLPLVGAGDAGLADIIQARLGISRANLGLPR